MKYLNLKDYFIKFLLSAAILCGCSQYVLSQKKAAKPEKPVAVKKSAVKLPLVVQTPPMLIDTFFKKYKDNGSGAAIDFLFGTNKLFNNEEQIELLKIKLDSLQKSVGQYLGRELLAHKTAGASLVFDSYLVKFMNQPIRFTFMFYKPQKEWKLYRFKYDDQMDAELEDAGRIDNYKKQ